MLKWRRRLKRTLLYGVATIAIVLALLVGLLQLALPWWASNPDRVARLISSRIDTPVAIEETQSYWSVRGPLIELRGVRIGDGEGALIERASWATDLSGLVRSDRPLYEFRVHGLDLTLARSPEGRWRLRGLPTLIRGDGSQSVARVLRSLPALAVRDSRLRIQHSDDAEPVSFHLAELRRFDGVGKARWRGRLTPGIDTAGELQLSVDVDRNEQAKVYLGGDDLNLADWLGSYAPVGVQLLDGRLSLAVWIDLDAGGVRDAQWRWQQQATRWRAQVAVPAGTGETVKTAAVTPDAQPPVDDAETTADVELPKLTVAGRWLRDGDEARLLVHELVFGEHRDGRIVGQLRDGLLRVQGSDLHVTPFAALLALAEPLPPAARRWLVEGRPQGRIDRLQVDFDDDGLRQFGIVLDDWRSNAITGSVPGVSGLNATIRGDRNGIVVAPGRNALTVELPGVLAEPVTATIGTGEIAAWRLPGGGDEDDGDEDGGHGGWRLASDALHLSGDGFEARLTGAVELRPGDRPYLDLGGTVSGDLLGAPRFLPINTLRNTRNWLKKSITGGRLVTSHAWFRGPAVRLPFEDQLGHFEAELDVEGAGLDYHVDWPGLRDVKARLLFENARLAITGQRFRIGELSASDATAEVPNLRQAIMRVSGSSREQAQALKAFLAHTPLQARFGDYLDAMSVSGEPQVEIDLQLPLKRELGQVQVDGKIRFDGGRFHYPEHNLDLGGLRGELRFDRHGMAAKDLAATIVGEPVRVDLRIGAATTDEQLALEAELRGEISLAAALDPVPRLVEIGKAAQGRAHWQATLALPEKASGRNGSLRVESDLRGIQLRLPDPLRKPASTVVPLTVEVALGEANTPIGVHLGDLLAMNARLPSQSRSLLASIALGGGRPEPLPQRGMIITGQPVALDVGGWLAMPWGDGDAAGWPLVQLSTGELDFFGRVLRDVDLRVEPRAESAHIAVTGRDVAGTVSWPLRPSVATPVRVELSRLHLPDVASGDDDPSSADPMSLPALDVTIADFSTGAIALGAVRMLGHPGEAGYRVERFESRSPLFNIDAAGDWQRAGASERSRFVVDLKADDLGEMLTSLGFDSQVEGGAVQARIDGSWPGAPAAFALEKIDGALTLNVGSGRILEVDPGMGRLFGLLNLREIPRRLMLDFRDIFSQGMRFTSIEGSFRLDAGNAFTESIAVKSPSADIIVSGRTGLTDRDYDQTLHVMPRVGGTLPVVGAIAGGPAGAAAGLVMQGLLRLDDASSIVYRVTGPWSAPVITRIDEDEAAEPVASVRAHTPIEELP